MFTISSSLDPHAGFHTSSRSLIKLEDSALLERCTLHLYYDLPPLIFFDPYELALRSDSYNFRHMGEVNLELPIAAMRKENSELLLNVTYWPGDLVVEVDVPLHARYGEPNSVGYVEVDVPRPKGFFACGPSLNPAIHASDSPLWEMEPHLAALFDPEASKFVELKPTSSDTHDVLRVPVGTPSDLPFVEIGTVLCILSVFVYLSVTLWRTFSRLQVSQKERRAKVE
ncbi:hypothetical protein ONZ45_g18906 [Pleurotus djamor]|nr:hypothetical protein ONZ45_g18906 [Pleurotus djamor]